MRVLAIVVTSVVLSSCSPATSAPSSPLKNSTPHAAASAVSSDDPARTLLTLLARFAPEQLGELNLGTDERAVADFAPNLHERFQTAMANAIRGFELDLKTTSDPARQFDLAIIVRAAKRFANDDRIDDKYFLPYSDVPKTIFIGLSSLLKREKKDAALVRLQRYVGLEANYEPIARASEARLRQKFSNPSLLGPLQTELEQHLANIDVYLAGIAKLAANAKDPRFEAPLVTLRGQLASYADFLRREVAPRARRDFRLPAEKYGALLSNFGVDIPPAELGKRARAAYARTLEEMKKLGPDVARGAFPKESLHDYRDVLRRLKADILSGDALVQLYERRLQQLEAIAREHQLVNIPRERVLIRLASEAETAQIPAPTIDTSALFAPGAIALVIPGAAPSRGGERLRYDDYLYSAASWPIAAHEGRPGHELQFSRIKELPISLTRKVFALNSVNVEGWGLYAEGLVYPYLPHEGQLVALAFRGLREARAFIDPELQQGTMSLEEARRILEDELVFSPGTVKQELDRYTYEDPGQATSYFYGATEMKRLRDEMESALGPRFHLLQFHEAVLGQGLLPPPLLREGVRKALLGTNSSTTQ